VYASLAPLVSYQTELENTKARLIETGDVGGSEFVQRLMDANQRAISNLTNSQSGFSTAGTTAVGGAVSAAQAQGGNFAGASRSVGEQGTTGLAGGAGGMRDAASRAVDDAAAAAGLGRANMHNIGLGLGMALSEGMIAGRVAVEEDDPPRTRHG